MYEEIKFAIEKQVNIFNISYYRRNALNGATIWGYASS